MTDFPALRSLASELLRLLVASADPDTLRYVVRTLEPYRPPRRPRRPTITFREVYTMAREKRYAPDYQFPDLDEDEDVDVRELTISVDGTAQPAQEFPGDDETPIVDLGLQLKEGQVLEVSEVHVDAAGNRSKARVSTVTVTDNVAPPQPGEAGFTLRETYVDVPDEPGPVPDEPLPPIDEPEPIT